MAVNRKGWVWRSKGMGGYGGQQLNMCATRCGCRDCASLAVCVASKKYSFIHYTHLLPAGSGTYSPHFMSIGGPVLAAGIPTVPHPYVVSVNLEVCDC